MKRLFSGCFMSLVSVTLGVSACGGAPTPATSIALGHTKNCNDAGVWDGLECATAHVQAADDAPPEKPKTVAHRKSNPVPPRPASDDCDCDAQDPLCECDSPP